MSRADLFRMKNILSDRRKVYVSKRGLIHLVTEAGARQWLESCAVVRGVLSDECVYARDLSSYGRRSLYLGSLLPFTRVARSEVEPVSTSIDPDAFILGGARACEQGVFSRAATYAPTDEHPAMRNPGPTDRPGIPGPGSG